MIFVYVGGALLAGLLIGLSVIAILWIGSSISASIRAKTISLISSYDKVIEEKSNEVARLNEQLEKQNDLLAQLALEDDKKDKKATPTSDNSALKSVERISMSQYSDKDLSEKYQQIKDTFDIDPITFINSLSSRYTTTVISSIENFLNDLSYDTVCNLSTLSSKDQYKILNDTVNADIKKILKSFCKDQNKFNIIEFYEYLRERAANENRAPILRLGPGNKITGIPDYIQVEIDPDIVEGFQYLYHNKLYDYALKKKEIS